MAYRVLFKPDTPNSIKLTELRRHVAELIGTYEFKYVCLDLRDVMCVEISDDVINGREILRLMYKVKK